MDKIYEKIDSLRIDNIIEEYNNIGKEGFDSPEVEEPTMPDAQQRQEWWNKAKAGQCILQLNIIFKIPIWIVKFLLKIVIWVLKFLVKPVDFLLRKLLGEYYEMLIMIFQTIYKIYSIILPEYFILYLKLFGGFFTLINIFFVILFCYYSQYIT